VLDRVQEDTLQLCLEEHITWVPFFPLGSAFPGFPSVADNPAVQKVSDRIGATPAQIGLAWLLAHAPNTLLIPGTRSIAHLDDNAAAGSIQLDAEALAVLDGVGTLPGADTAHRHGAEPFLAESD
jgi:aryl-alcohol dehydrogenase-like predicted oxidoreductase